MERLPDDKHKIRCHLCDTKLKRNKFYHTTYQDLGALATEEAVAKVYKVFNHTRADFDSVHDYNLFLEERERLIYNLVNKIDVQQTKERIKEHKEKKKVLTQQGIQLQNESKMSTSEAKSAMQRYVIEEYNRVRNRRQKRENLLTSWAHGTLKAEEVVGRGNTIEREDERLSLREPQVVLKYTKPGTLASSSSSSAAMYRPSPAALVRGQGGAGGDGPELADPNNPNNIPKTPKSMNSVMTTAYNVKLDSMDAAERVKCEKAAKQAGGFKSTLFASRCIHEAFSAL